LNLQVEKAYLIVNRAPGGKLDEGIQAEIEAQQLSLIGVLPQDELVYEYDAGGKPLVKLPEDAPVRKALAEIIQKLKL
jgi:CO dehydrogenase maturation factor